VGKWQLHFDGELMDSKRKILQKQETYSINAKAQQKESKISSIAPPLTANTTEVAR
jgi:hypothetical protein